ncbi:glutathione S-transferase N-terminal domain-containing protein [Cystobacter ferrugineus]|uniref:glutathione S-transferase N-terminal domain-containing protein n=1 Tax=Cystobacter ferrugineus TaxID=83449 RepID=UPI00318422D1
MRAHPEFLEESRRLSPLKTTPVLVEEDGRVLGDSTAISHYRDRGERTRLAVPGEVVEEVPQPELAPVVPGREHAPPPPGRAPRRWRWSRRAGRSTGRTRGR